MPVGTTCGDLIFPRKDVVHGILPEVYRNRIHNILYEEAIAIEESTRDQANSARWFEERKTRITASNFHKIVKRKMAVTEKFVDSIINPKSFNSKAVSYGKKSETKAREVYVTTSGHHVHDCGLVVNPLFPFIGASPDAKICDNSLTGIMEIKCPYSQRDSTINEAVSGADFCLENTENGKKLRQNHDYYIQVQGQLLVTGAPFCDFVVYTKKDIHIQRIVPNQEFIQNVLNKLSDFYFMHVYTKI